MTTREAILVLTRRRDFLAARIAIWESRHPDAEEDMRSYDRAEVAALTLALAAFEDAERIGLPRLGRLSVLERERLRALLEAGERAA